MLHQIASLALSAATAILTALPVGMVAHNHCDAPENPLCVPKGFVVPHDDGGLSGVVDVALRGSGRIDPTQPPTQQG